MDTLIWLDVADGEPTIRKDCRGEHYAVTADSSKMLFGGSLHYHEDPKIRWSALPDVSTWTPIRIPDEPFDFVYGLSSDSTGERLALAHSITVTTRGGPTIQPAVSVMRMRSGKQIVRLPQDAIMGALAFCPTADTLVMTGGVEGMSRVRSYQISSGAELWHFDPPGARSRGLAVAEDGRIAVANSSTVYLLPADRPEPLFTMAELEGRINAVTFAPGGEQLLSASQDGAIRIWDSRTGRLLKSFDWGIGAVRAVAFSPDGLTCAAGGEKGQVVVWDVDQ